MHRLALHSVRSQSFRSGRHPGGAATAGLRPPGGTQRGPPVGQTAGAKVQDDPSSPPPDEASDLTGFRHEPVLLDKVVELFAGLPGGLFVDATLGGGGHSEAVLSANPRLRLLGIDRDERAVEAARRRLSDFDDRVEIVRGSFDQLGALVQQRSVEGARAVLMDLGVSSPQLDEGERGFSYRSAAPLDMRMDRRQAMRAEEVVNQYPYAQLRRVIETYGEERFASRIARAIVDARPVPDTAQLAEIVRGAIPAPARRTGGHPAKRTFQAIRIEVNRELEQLADALDAALANLAPGGRVAVLSYHSLEDRLVKQRLRDASTGSCVCPPGLECVCGAVPTVRLLKRGAWKAEAAEIARNPRAESVRLRAAEALGPHDPSPRVGRAS